VPMDRDADGLPVGIQLVGRPWQEETLLALAVRLEAAGMT
jgi:Asp-tRNA(Asn)/Glu-tRNA(Gln) amidotransferase A subunit family amidase